jgi:hypothetical protein
VPNLVPIKKREGGRRPPWIGCKLCLDLNEIFLVCILLVLVPNLRIFPCVHGFDLGPNGWSELLARFSFLENFHSCWFTFWSSSRALGPGPVLIFFSGARVRQSRVFSRNRGAAVRVFARPETAPPFFRLISPANRAAVSRFSLRR